MWRFTYVPKKVYGMWRNSEVGTKSRNQLDMGTKNKIQTRMVMDNHREYILEAGMSNTGGQKVTGIASDYDRATLHCLSPLQKKHRPR